MLDQNIIVSIVVTVNTIVIVMAWSMLTQKNQMPVEGRTVLLTGASQGMGLETARLLSSKGANIIIAARDQLKLDDAIQQIAAAALHPHTQRFFTISVDLTTAEANDEMLSRATEWNDDTPPDIIWALAGSSVPSLFLDSTPEIMKAQMDINYFAAAFLARSTLRTWLAYPTTAMKGKGGKAPTEEERSRHFIMTASIAALVSLAGYVPYSPGKAAMRSLHDGLTSELNFYNAAFSKMPSPQPPQIKTHLIIPGTILSPGYEQENKTKHPVTKMLDEGDEQQTAEAAAKGAMSGLERGRGMVSTQGLWGEVIKGSAWASTPRDRPFYNTIMSWITSLAWLYVSWEMATKVWKMGERDGLPKHASVEEVKKRRQ